MLWFDGGKLKDLSILASNAVSEVIWHLVGSSGACQVHPSCCGSMLRFKHSFECENFTSGFHKKGSLQNHMTISHRRDITVIIALKKFTQRFLCRVTWLSSTGMISVQQVWLQSSRKSFPEETQLSRTGMISVQQLWLQSSRESSSKEAHDCFSHGKI